MKGVEELSDLGFHIVAHPLTGTNLSASASDRVVSRAAGSDQGIERCLHKFIDNGCDGGRRQARHHQGV